MKHKQRLELIVKNGDPFKAIDRVRDKPGIYTANLGDVDTIVIFYDDRKTTEQEIKQTIQPGKIIPFRQSLKNIS